MSPEARSRVYGLLARALRYPDEELFEALRSGAWAAGLAEAAPVAELERLPESLPADLSTLQQWHTNLFSSGGAVPHQESDYVAGHAFQKTDLMADVAGFYAAFGVRVSGSQREMPDFLGTELEFLHLAALREACALEEGNAEAAAVCREAQEKFLAEHLGVWVGRFRERIEGGAAGRFYALLARLIESCVGRMRPEAAM